MKYDLTPQTFPKPVFVFIFTAVFKISMKFECFLRPFFVAIWDHLEEFLRCGDLKLRCVRFGETAWHVSCDLGLRCESALRSAAICVARCEIAKIVFHQNVWSKGIEALHQDHSDCSPQEPSETGATTYLEPHFHDTTSCTFTGDLVFDP